MKIRSITYFLYPGWPLDLEKLRAAGGFIAEARPAFEAAGYEVQTVRLATTPFPTFLDSISSKDVLQFVEQIENQAKSYCFDYVSIGPALPDDLASYGLIYDVIRSTDIVFAAGMMTTIDGDVSLPAIRACAQVIHRLSRLSPDGFANLRFAALANILPGAPFFPSAYHAMGGVEQNPVFALATEAADLVVNAVRNAPSLVEVRERLVIAVEKNARKLNDVARLLEAKFNIRFGGIDFTPAPFPQRELSFGTAIEDLGVPSAGSHGSLAAVAFLEDALDRATFPRAGINGLFFPVLEDAVLAERAAQGTLTVKDLLLYSTVCGTGLDTLPLPGDISVDDLYAILLDVAMLSWRLSKPLTARLLPIPGKAAGDMTDFDFDYFANSRVMKVEASALRGLLAVCRE